MIFGRALLGSRHCYSNLRVCLHFEGVSFGTKVMHAAELKIYCSCVCVSEVTTLQVS